MTTVVSVEPSSEPLKSPCAVSTAVWREGQFGADDGQSGAFNLGQTHHRVEVAEVDRDASGDLRNAAIAGRADDFFDACAAFGRPGECMFASAGTEDENLHDRASYASQC